MNKHDFSAYSNKERRWGDHTYGGLRSVLLTLLGVVLLSVGIGSLVYGVAGVVKHVPSPHTPPPQLETTDIPDRHGVVCYMLGDKLSCVKVTTGSSRAQ